MPRYIDADALIAEYDRVHVGPAGGARKLMTEAPIADVAPKSEVEEIIYKLECLLCHATGSKLSKYTYDLRTMETVVTDYINESYDEGYRDAKSEVAREIFAEIEEIIDRTLCLDINAYSAYEELKKKYTEEKE